MTARSKHRFAAARLPRLWVRILQGAWLFFCCECCVLSGRGLCDELIIRPEESYRMWCVVVCDLETSRIRRPWSTGGCLAKNRNNNNNNNNNKNILLFSNVATVVNAECRKYRHWSTPYFSFIQKIAVFEMSQHNS